MAPSRRRANRRSQHGDVANSCAGDFRLGTRQIADESRNASVARTGRESSRLLERLDDQSHGPCRSRAGQKRLGRVRLSLSTRYWLADRTMRFGAYRCTRLPFMPGFSLARCHPHNRNDGCGNVLYGVWHGHPPTESSQPPSELRRRGGEYCSVFSFSVPMTAFLATAAALQTRPFLRTGEALRSGDVAGV